MCSISTSLLHILALQKKLLLRRVKPCRLFVLSASFFLFACTTTPQKGLEQSPQIVLADFTTDGCSMFPDGTAAQPKLWCQCCVEHDKAYWAGGTEDARRDADIKLKECVLALGQTKTAKIIWFGVRIGGSAYWPTPFRWSYGWPYTRGYQALNLAEQAVAQEKLQKYNQHEMDFCTQPTPTK